MASASGAETAVLDRIFESICRPLRVRVEQVLLASPALLLCFELSQLLAFYGTLVERTLGKGSQLAAVVHGCHDMAQRSFLDGTRAAGERLLRQPPPPPADLSPPSQLLEALQQVMGVVQVRRGAAAAAAHFGLSSLTLALLQLQLE